MLQTLIPVLVGIGLDVAHAARKRSDGGKRITRAERDAIIAHAVERLVGKLDEVLPVGEDE